MHRKSILVCFIIAAAPLILASCGGSQENKQPEQTPAPETSTMEESTMEESTMEEPTMEEPTMEGVSEGASGGAGSEGDGEVVVVKMSGLTYEPSSVEVSPGTTVRWENEDDAEHTVTSEDEGGPLDSDVFRSGGAYEYTFEEPGEFGYYCVVHPFMKGVVTVR